MSASQQDNIEGKRKEKKGLDYTFGRELNEKLGNIPGCPKQDNINMCRLWVSSLLSQPALLCVRASRRALLMWSPVLLLMQVLHRPEPAKERRCGSQECGNR